MSAGESAGARVAFAQQLRGVAALCVVWLHLGASYWFGRGFVHAQLGLPVPVAAADPPWWALASHQLQTLGTGRAWWDVGAFGVALFFLISGFVIPMSLNQLGPTRFLLARVVRIYPVYLCSLLLWPLVWAGFEGLYGGAATGGLPITVLQWCAHLLMVGDLLGLPPIDLVSWTLQIEMRFYLAVALLYGSVGRLQLRGVGVFWCVVLTLGALKFGLERAGELQGADPLVVFVLNQNLKQLAMVGFIFGGYLLYLYWRGMVGMGQLVIGLVGTELAFVLLMQLCGIKGSELKLMVLNQLLAVVVFVAVMRGSAWTGGQVLAFYARISYPLYTVHLIVGWSTLVVLEQAQVPAAVALPVAWALVTLVAWLVHQAVELPSQRLLERWKRRPAPRFTGATAPTTAEVASVRPRVQARRRPSR